MLLKSNMVFCYGAPGRMLWVCVFVGSVLDVVVVTVIVFAFFFDVLMWIFYGFVIANIVLWCGLFGVFGVTVVLILVYDVSLVVCIGEVLVMSFWVVQVLVAIGFISVEFVDDCEDE